MSMKPDEQNFEQLRRLLALKRHEQPHPRYFNDFSQQVVARIKAGDTASETGLSGMLWEVPWLQRFWALMEAKPIMALTFALTACIFLAGGIAFTENTTVGIALPPTPFDVAKPAANPATGDQMALMDGGSTNGLFSQPERASLFEAVGNPRSLQVQPVSFGLPIKN
jgi:hypothetical protein